MADTISLNSRFPCIKKKGCDCEEFYLLCCLLILACFYNILLEFLLLRRLLQRIRFVGLCILRIYITLWNLARSVCLEAGNGLRERLYLQIMPEIPGFPFY